MASEEPPLTYSRAHITSVFLMALVKHMSPWFFCALVTYSFSILTALSLITAFFHYLPGQHWPFYFVKGVCTLSRFSPVCLCDPMDGSLWAPLSKGFCRQGYWSELPCPLWVRDWTCYSCVQEDSLPLSHQVSTFCWELAVIFHRPLKATPAVMSFESTSKAMNSCLSSYILFALSKTLKTQSKVSSLPLPEYVSLLLQFVKCRVSFLLDHTQHTLGQVMLKFESSYWPGSQKRSEATPGEWGERLLPCKREASISSSPVVEY